MFEHPLANVFESDRHFVNATAITRCDFIEQLRRGKSLGEIAADLARAREVPEQDRENLVRGNECAVRMDGPDAIAISIGGKAGMVPAAANGFAQSRDVGFDGFRIDATKNGIAAPANLVAGYVMAPHE